jgi:thiamine transport system permease protein
MARRDAVSRTLLYTGAVLFFALFFFVPIAGVYVEAFRDVPLAAVLSRIWGILGSGRTASIIGFTTGQAALSSLIGVLAALPLAYMVSHYTFPGKRLVYSLSLIPFILPSIVVVICMISFYGKSGLLNSLLGTDYNLVYNFRGIVLAHVFYNFSLAIRIISTAWLSIDRRYREAAETLGERPLGLLVRVTLPLLAPAILSAFVLIFIYTFLSFGIILVFGGVRFATLEVAIYQEIFVNLDLVSAAVFSMIQLALSLGFIALSARVIHATRSARSGVDRGLPSLRSAGPVGRVVMSAYGIAAVVFVLGPILTMFGRALTDANGALSFESFRQLLVPGAADRNVEGILRSTVPGVILRSIAIASASGTMIFLMAGALALSLRGRRRTAFESFLQIPIGMSFVTVSLGLRFVWGATIPPAALVVMGQFFIGFPLVFRILRTGVEELGDNVVRSAQILGADRWAVLRDIELPLLRRTLLNAYAYALALPFADLTVVLAAGRGRIATFPVAIYRLIGFRSFDLALALSVIYILLCLGLFLVIDATSLRSPAPLRTGAA